MRSGAVQHRNNAMRREDVHGEIGSLTPDAFWCRAAPQQRHATHPVWTNLMLQNT